MRHIKRLTVKGRAIFFVVGDGGPCSGKDSIIPRLAQKLEEVDVPFIVIPEAATFLMEGMRINPRTGRYFFPSFQRWITKYYDFLTSIIEECVDEIDGEGPIVVYSNRGIMSGMAYEGFVSFRAILKNLGHVGEEIFAMYDLILLMVTAANGAEEFYTCANNAARNETPEQARRLDRKTRAAWRGHPNVVVVDNSTDFEGKKLRALQAVFRLIGLPAPLAKERKFLVKPFNPRQLGVTYGTVEITQIYLSSNDENVELKVRMRENKHGGTSYYHIAKRRFSPKGKIVVTERIITGAEYERLIATKADPRCKTVRKTRFYFTLGMHYFRLDRFRDHLQGLHMLELVTTDKKAVLPAGIARQLNKDVTDIPTYQNRSLSRLKKLPSTT